MSSAAAREPPPAALRPSAPSAPASASRSARNIFLSAISSQWAKRGTLKVPVGDRK